MASIDKLRASDGSGNASVATVQSTRSGGASTIVVDTVQGINTNFYGTMGTPHTFTDPVTSETITVISEATAVDFQGHVDGSNLEIDVIAPGYTDNGSAVGDIVIIRPTTQWADEVADVLDVAHNDNGTLKNDSITSETLFTDNVDPVKRDDEMTFDFVASGGVWTGDSYGSNRNASMTALVAYINGQRGTISAVTARTFTASKDTYIDVLNTAGVFTLVYTEVANNAASPALAADSIRLGIIVTGASNIANAGSVNQGQETKVLPIASSLPYQVTDSLGNLICPRDSSRRLLGYRILTANQGSITTEAVITGLNVPIIIPQSGRKIKITLSGIKSNTNASTDTIRVRETNLAGTQVGGTTSFTAAATAGETVNMSFVITPSSTNINYVVTMAVASGTLTANSGMSLTIELV